MLQDLRKQLEARGAQHECHSQQQQAQQVQQADASSRAEEALSAAQRRCREAEDRAASMDTQMQVHSQSCRQEAIGQNCSCKMRGLQGLLGHVSSLV